MAFTDTMKQTPDVTGPTSLAANGHCGVKELMVRESTEKPDRIKKI